MQPLKTGILAVVITCLAYLFFMSCYHYTTLKPVRNNYTKIAKGNSKEIVLELLGAPPAYNIKEGDIVIWKYRLNNNIFYTRAFDIRFKNNQVDSIYFLED